MSKNAVATNALRYAVAGFTIVPTDQRKVALVKWAAPLWETPPTAEQVSRWWRKWPDAWIGMLTGHRSGLDVIDLDFKGGKNGFAAVPYWRDLTPLMARTPSGSVHLYFKSVGIRSTASVIAPGVDTRGEGGLVILPPSGGRQWLKGHPFCGLQLQLPPVPDRLRPDARPRSIAPAPTFLAGENTGAGIHPDETSAAEVEAALSVLDPNCSYDEWYRIGAACKDFPELFIEWSSEGRKYPGDRECARRAKEFANMASITIATLFHMATEANPDWRKNIREDAGCGF